jgi:glutaredoxin
MIEIYTKTNCSACLFTKTYLEKQGMAYTEFLVGDVISVDDVKAKFPGVTQVPIVVIDGNFIGGYNELSEYLAKAA